jgi:hypothetical protein
MQVARRPLAVQLSGLPRPLRWVLGLLALAVLLLLNRLELLTARMDRSNDLVVETAELLYVPDRKLTSALFLGYDQAAADALWVRTTEYFGRHFATDRHYVWLEHFIDLILELDPRFRRVYHWAGTNVLYGRRFTNENVLRSNHYYQKALEQFPTDYEAAYRLGRNYYVEMRSKDPEEARRFREQGAQYLEMAANMPGAPPFLGRLVASLYRKLGKNEVALQYYIELMLETDDPVQRQVLKQRMVQLGGADADAIVAEIGEQEKRYKDAFPYLSRALFALVDRPAGDAAPDVDWRTLLPIFQAGEAVAAPPEPRIENEPVPVPAADAGVGPAEARRAEAPR